MGMLVSPMVAEIEVEVVEGPTTFPEAAREEVTIEPFASTKVVVPRVVMETVAKMAEDSTTLMIESALEDVNVQTREMTLRSPEVVDQVVAEGSGQGHHDGGGATRAEPSNSQGTNSSSFDEEEEEEEEEEFDLFFPEFFCVPEVRTSSHRSRDRVPHPKDIPF